MWIDTDYDNLKTLNDIVEEVGEEAVFGATDLDDATRQNILNWFKYRKVCDNTQFIPFFQRVIDMNTWQYDQLLRVQSVEFDPMVAEYMERQVLQKGTRSGKGGRKSTTTNDTSTNTEGSASGTSKGKQTNALKTVQSGETETNSSVHVGGDDVTDVNTTVTGGGTVGVEGKSDDEKNMTGSSGHKSMTGQLPQSSINASGGFPEALNWQYVTQQDENKDTNQSKETDKHTDSQTTTRNTTDTTSGTTTVTHDVTTTGHDTGTTTNTTDNTGTVSNDGETQEKHNSVVKNTGTVTVEDETNEDTTDNNDTRERYTGRHEAPQDMLDRARSFIMKTNAFVWLIDKLEPCFMSVYDI